MRTRPRLYWLMVFVLSSCSALPTGSSTTGSTSTTFSKPTNLQIAAVSGLGTAYGLIAGRFNNDSYTDLVMLTSSGAFLYLNQGGSSWLRSAVAGTEALPIRAGDQGDIDADANSIDDLILFHDYNALLLLRNNGNGVFSTVSTLSRGEQGSDLAYAPKAIVSPSANNDSGFVFFTPVSGNPFSVQQADLLWGTAESALGSTLGGASGLRVKKADFNRDGKIDFLLAPRSGSLSMLAIKNQNDTSLVTGATVTRVYTAEMNDLSVADINGDNRPDILMATSGGLELLLASADFTWVSSDAVSPTNFSTPASAVVVADFTGDGKADIYMGRSSTKGIFYSQTDTAVFSDTTSTTFGSITQATGADRVYAVDVNNDSELDLLELNNDGRVVVYLNNR